MKYIATKEDQVIVDPKIWPLCRKCKITSMKPSEVRKNVYANESGYEIEGWKIIVEYEAKALETFFVLKHETLLDPVILSTVEDVAEYLNMEKERDFKKTVQYIADKAIKVYGYTVEVLYVKNFSSALNYVYSGEDYIGG